jgi:pyridoxal/pyridoxine/pyridoxamine kinase
MIEVVKFDTSRKILSTAMEAVRTAQEAVEEAQALADARVDRALMLRDGAEQQAAYYLKQREELQARVARAIAILRRGKGDMCTAAVMALMELDR